MYPIAKLRIQALKLVTKVLPFPKPFTFVGPDSSLALCRDVADAGVKSLVIFTDAPVLKLGLLDGILAALREAGIKTDVFSDIEPDPGFETIEAGVAFLEQKNAQAVLVVGGGSPMDAAKTIVACHANHCHPRKLVGLFKVRKHGLPLYAIPTTAGTGSEVTIAAVVSDREAQTKLAIADPKLVPLKIALDPKLMLGLPPAITAATGMDALTHAVEAYLCTLSNAETDQLALDAAVTIVRNLPLAYAPNADVNVRERMAVASCMAGMAFTRVGLGYVHAISHQLGGLYHIPHGLANSIVLPHVLEFSKSDCAPRLAALARACKIRSKGADDMALADAFIAHVRKMNKSMGIPAVIDGLRLEDLDLIVERAFKEAHGTYAVPRYLAHSECIELLSKMLPKSPSKASRKGL